MNPKELKLGEICPMCSVGQMVLQEVAGLMVADEEADESLLICDVCCFVGGHSRTPCLNNVTQNLQHMMNEGRVSFRILRSVLQELVQAAVVATKKDWERTAKERQNSSEKVTPYTLQDFIHKFNNSRFDFHGYSGSVEKDVRQAVAFGVESGDCGFWVDAILLCIHGASHFSEIQPEVLADCLVMRVEEGE